METIDGLLLGITAAFTLTNLLAALIGAFLGTLLGVIPGIGSVTGAAILLPLTFGMDPLTGLIALGAVYFGVLFGGSTTAILLNIPGDASSIVTAIEGNQLAKQGRAGPALGIVAVASLVGGTVSLLLVSVLAPIVSRVAVGFGGAEFFALTAGGLLILARLFGGKLSAGLLPLALGLLLGTIGLDPNSGVNRFTFGQGDLSLGIGIIAIAAGVFGVSEIVRMIGQGEDLPPVRSVKFRDVVPTKKDMTDSLPAVARGTGLGFVMGLLPGPSITLATFLSYRLEKGMARGEKKQQFGKGAMAGLAGPEGANNSAATSGLVPVLMLGLPFSATLALMLVAMRVHGIQAGPRIQVDHPEIFWGFIAAMLLGNIALFILNLNFIRVWVSLLRVPVWLLLPTVLVTAGAGVFVARNSLLDVLVFLLSGAVGYALHKGNFHLAPLLLGVLLGPLIETYLLQGLAISGGDLTYFISRPVAVAIWVIVVIVLTLPAALGITRRLRMPARVRQ